MRLSNIRSGLQDYEYFALLQKLKNSLPDSERGIYEPEIDHALTIGPDLIRSPYDWTKNRSLLEQRRQKIGQLIEKIMAAERTTAEGSQATSPHDDRIENH